MGPIPGRRSIMNSMSQFGGILGRSSGNISEYSQTMGTSSIDLAYKAHNIETILSWFGSQCMKFIFRMTNLGSPFLDMANSSNYLETKCQLYVP